MEGLGHFSIIIKGTVGDSQLTPRNYDVREVSEAIQHFLDLAFGGEKKDRPLVTYALEEGSVKHVFTTGLAIVASVTQQLETVRQTGSLASLDPVQANALLWFQERAAQKGYTYLLGTSEAAPDLLVLDRSTRLARQSRQWVETELYFYGQIVDAGGQARSNIHLLTAEHGPLTLTTPRALLAALRENPLYKSYGVRVIGKQDALTSEIDFDSLRVQEITPYSAIHYDEDYIAELRAKATQSWLGELDSPDEWLNNLRGYDA